MRPENIARVSYLPSISSSGSNAVTSLMPRPHTAFRVSSYRKLHHRGVERLVDPLTVHGAVGGRTGVLDLSKLEFITPSGAVTLITMLNHKAYDFESIQLVCPQDSNCLSYMGVSGFFQFLPDYVELVGDRGYGEQAGRWGSHTVLPITRLDSSEDVDKVGQRVRRRFGKMMGNGSADWQKIKLQLASTAKELCRNIFDHARIGTGWVAAQKYPYARTPYVELAIGDAGRGIRSSLSERYPSLKEASDAVAIRKMISEGLSRRAGNGGAGYHVLQRAATELDGRFMLRSGRGAVRQPRRRQELVSWAENCNWPGTQLMVRLSCA